MSFFQFQSIQIFVATATARTPRAATYAIVSRGGRVGCLLCNMVIPKIATLIHHKYIVFNINYFETEGLGL